MAVDIVNPRNKITVLLLVREATHSLQNGKGSNSFTAKR